MSSTGTVRIGISGWTYAPWRGNFYPPVCCMPTSSPMRAGRSTRSRSTARFTGCSAPMLLPAGTTRPGGFCLRGQGPALHHPHPAAARDRDRRSPISSPRVCLRLEEKLGPVLWQFPPRFRFSAERLDHFFALLPRDTEAAAALPKPAASGSPSRAWAKTAQRRELRHAIEIRHRAFSTRPLSRCCDGIGWRWSSRTRSTWPYAEDMTADFVYLRLHGSEELYASGYSDEALDHWAARIKLWAAGREPNDARLIAADAEPAAPNSSRRLCLFRQRREGPGTGRRANAED